MEMAAVWRTSLRRCLKPQATTRAAPFLCLTGAQSHDQRNLTRASCLEASIYFRGPTPNNDDGGGAGGGAFPNRGPLQASELRVRQQLGFLSIATGQSGTDCVRSIFVRGGKEACATSAAREGHRYGLNSFCCDRLIQIKPAVASSAISKGTLASGSKGQ